MYRSGLSLSGGGARGSYQAGVLRGLVEILKEQGLEKNIPFVQYISGVSAGAINAAFLGAGIDDLELTTQKLVDVWSRIEPENVYRTDLRALTTNSARWVRDLTFGNMFKSKLAHSLLDTEPLWEHLKKQIQFENIEQNIVDGKLKSLACSAYSYTKNRTVTFLRTEEDILWDRQRRISEKTKINLDHIMASCAIPLLFPAIKIKNEYYADGGFRNLSPISPMVHMNVRKILVVGVRGSHEFSEKSYRSMPTIAKVSGAMLNALFFDTIDIDLERLRHINELLAATKATIETQRSSYSQISYMVIRPSRDVSQLALNQTRYFPRMIRFLMGGLGPMNESAELASYILFVPQFTKTMIDLGYNDARAKKSELLQWMESHVG